jgi:uncharacterized protein (TIGR02118 family)
MPPVTKLVYCVRRASHLSEEEFQHYWLEHHGPLVRSLWEDGRFPGMLRYVQSHTISGAPSDNLQASRGSGPAYDGITEVWFDVAAQQAGRGTTGAAGDAGERLFEDESKFIDFEHSSVFMTTEHVIFDAADGS